MGRPKGFIRSELLEKAAAVFWTKGFADTSLSDLEEATGVKKSGLYSEFKDKDELFVNCLKYYIEEVDTLEELMSAPLGWKNIVSFFSCAQECQDSKGCFVGISMRESAILPALANTLIKKHFDQLTEMLTKNLEAEGFGKSSALYAEMIKTFFLGLSLDQTLTDSSSLQMKIDEFLELIGRQRSRSQL